jgi:hypothetical protein
MIWGNNKKEIADLQAQVNKAISDICSLQHNVELLKTNQNSLRGFVNRKIGIAETTEEDIKKTEKKDINSSVFLLE